jgi:hypothetical protein
MTISLNFRQAAFAQETGVFPIGLITIDHTSLAEPIRFSTDPTQRLVDTVSEIVYGTVSNSEQYYFFPCSLKLPDDTDDGPGQMQMIFDNVNKDYVAIIRSIVGRPTVNASFVMSNDLDTIERQWPEFFIGRIPWDATRVTLNMEMETLDREPFPWGTYTPGAFPGLFRGL